MAKKTTLTDVARLAHVAVGTASEALNNKPGISPETRARVIEAARQMGYDQRYITGPDPKSMLKTIGVIKHEHHDYPGFDPFYFPVISGVEHYCQRSGFGMMYATCEVDENNYIRKLPTTIDYSNLDGLVIVGTYLDKAFEGEIHGLKCPVVLIDGYSAHNHFDRVLTNNVEGAFAGVSYLIRNGHTHIGLIGTNPHSYPSIKERREGYLKALREHGIQETYIEESLLTREDAYAATLAILKQEPGLTALFVANDNGAFGAMNAVRSLSYDVPDRISLVGFDDISFAQDMIPPLTTMRVDKVRMGEVAVQQLLYRASNPGAPTMTVLMNANLVVRKSVKALKLGFQAVPETGVKSAP
jgi:LacI family transcriptional regulator